VWKYANPWKTLILIEFAVIPDTCDWFWESNKNDELVCAPKTSGANLIKK